MASIKAKKKAIKAFSLRLSAFSFMKSPAIPMNFAISFSTGAEV